MILLSIKEVNVKRLEIKLNIVYHTKVMDIVNFVSMVIKQTDMENVLK